MGVDDTFRDAEETGDFSFGVHVDVLCAVEVWRTAGTDPIAAEDLDSTFFEEVIGDEVEVIEGGKVVGCFAGGESYFGTGAAGIC